MSIAHISHAPVRKLNEHCAALSNLLHSLAFEAPASVEDNEETFGWEQPADWLDLASSVTKVDVLTGQFDESLHMCGSAMEYEDDRSAMLSQLATSLTVFTFVWGAFECIAKIMAPPSIPKELRKDGNDGLVARVVCALKSIKPDGVYYCRLANLQHRLAQHDEYRHCIPANLPPVMIAHAGEGIDLVRRVRNKFAHGAASLPQRSDWNGGDSLDNQVIGYSTRLVLLSIQMMLRVFFEGRNVCIETYEIDSDTDALVEVCCLLQTLHLCGEPTDQ